MKVPVIDNGGQWTHREYRLLRDLGVECEILPNTAPPERITEADAVVLSGGALSLEGTAKLGRVGEWIDRFDRPVLGICVGHHFLARHHGGEVGRSTAPEFGRVRLVVEPGEPLFAGLPTEIWVWENHNDQVTELPAGWHAFARSEHCAVQAMADPAGRRFGVQFHPEAEHTEGGGQIFENFLALVRR